MYNMTIPYYGQMLYPAPTMIPPIPTPTPTPTSLSSWEQYMANNLKKFVGQTITIFTVSGGTSGSGFTGVLMDIDLGIISLLSQISSPPACSLGNTSTGFGTQTLFGFRNPSSVQSKSPHSVGSITEIPIKYIAAFVHNAV
jgi:hypothetical protein